MDGCRVVPNRDLALRVAVIYSLTLDDSRLTRTLECAKRNEGAARRLLYKWSRNVDDRTGFWYGQLTSTGVTSWLQLRGVKPRVKSTNLLADHRIIEVALDKSIIYSSQKWLNDFTDPWVRRVEQPLMDYLPTLGR